MHLADADHIVDGALAAARLSGDDLLAALEALPAPIYVTDAEGVVTAFNAACTRFAGREPAAGKDRWCVTWKLYTEAGDALPHERCPMAMALQERRTIRGACAVAERPDGTRVLFVPFPTPFFDEGGELLGAINLLIDVTEARQAAELRAQAVRCRRLVAEITDRQAMSALKALATQCEAKAAELEGRQAAT